MEKIKISQVEEEIKAAPKRMPDEKAEKILDKVDFLALFDTLRVIGYYDFQRNESDPINDLRDLGRLVIELRDKLSGYDTILSDDAGGRLPSLLIRKLAKTEGTIRDIKNGPDLYFLASGRKPLDPKKEPGFVSRSAAIEKFLEKNARDFGKTLLVTEHIETGGSIQQLIEMLIKLGVDFDVATISIKYNDFENYIDHSYTNPLINRLYYGSKGNHSGAELFYDSSKSGMMAGVSKDNSVGAHPIKISGDEALVKGSRGDIDLLAKEFEKLL